MPRDTGRILRHRRIKEYPVIAYLPQIGLCFFERPELHPPCAIFSHFASNQFISTHSYWLNTGGSLISIVKEIPPGRVTAIHHELRSESEVSAGDTTGESLPDIWLILLGAFGLLIFLALEYFDFIVRSGLQRSLNILRLSAGFATQHNARREHIVSADRATSPSTSLIPWEKVTPRSLKLLFRL